MIGNVGDAIVIESERVGTSGRRGVIEDVVQEQPRRYKVRFLSNPNFHWQKRSLHSLRCFAVELVSITE